MTDPLVVDVVTGSSAEERFVRKRIERWRELQDLLERAQLRGLKSLGGEPVRRLGELYRTVTSDLALARTIEASEQTIRHVNRLCTVAHDLIYAGSRAGPAGRAFGFLTRGFPILVRKTWRYHAFACALVLLSTVAAYFAFRDDMTLAQKMFGGELFARAERAKALEGDARQYYEVPPVVMPFFSFGLVANNVQATIVMFAAGALFGVGTVFALLYNGIVFIRPNS